MAHIRIIFENAVIRAETVDSPTASAILAALPIDSSVNTWGEEVYFHAPVSAPTERDARVVVNAGEIAFWPDGSAIAIGFGPTPISTGDEIRLASPCNIWAIALDDMAILGNVPGGSAVRVEVD